MTQPFKGKTYWIVGASTGLGASLARQLRQEGAKLILSARNEEQLKILADQLGNSKVEPLDVTQGNSVTQAMDNIDYVDGVIYCVGQYQPMRTQDWDLEASLAIIDANYLGAVRRFSHVARECFERGYGHIVVIGSLAGFHGLPGAIGYSSSKGALMQLCENMFMDAHDTNVKVQQVNPGFIRSRLTEKNDFVMPSLLEPEDAAERIVRAMKGNRFRTSFPTPFQWLFTIGRLLPSRIYRRLFY